MILNYFNLLHNLLIIFITQTKIWVKKLRLSDIMLRIESKRLNIIGIIAKFVRWFLEHV
jgi:hypothetical protein